LLPPADRCAGGESPHYEFGFAALQRLLGAEMGQPLTCEFADPNGTGDVHQKTTRGLAFWRKEHQYPHIHRRLRPLGPHAAGRAALDRQQHRPAHSACSSGGDHAATSTRAHAGSHP